VKTSQKLENLKIHWLNLPLGRMRVRTCGAGPALILTHGLLVDSRIWDDVAFDVSDHGFMVVLPDLPLGAHTEPVADRGALTTKSLALSLFDLADQLALERFSILGFDTGGAIAQVATAAQPDRIERLALMSCDAFENYPPRLIKPFQWAARWPPAMSLVLKLLSDVRFQFAPLPLGLVAKRKLPQALVQAWSEPARTNQAIRADLVAFLLQMNERDTLAAANQLRCFRGPSTVMWSNEDRVFPKRDATRLAELLPNCQLRWIDDAFTFASLDNPARMFELIMEWLRSKPHSTS
jgi:pimeloyl-ACP methyl ester carboxylesterase